MVGKTLGHYEILEPLGAGGMSDVYRIPSCPGTGFVSARRFDYPPESLQPFPDATADTASTSVATEVRTWRFCDGAMSPESA